MKTKNIALMLSETLEHYHADQIVQGSYWSRLKKGAALSVA
jgi:hypothetical protein